jgi:ParB family chromosome partitioning protein
MRHDTHFVEQLGRPLGASVGRMIPVEDIDRNPDQPRRGLGDMAELVASVREKGILEPVLVRPQNGRFQIVAGERRFEAALQVGLDEVPCVVRETSDAEAMELALIENLQRRDLTPLEEADGLQSLADQHRYTHEKMAARLGKSRTSITEALSLASIPPRIRELCRLADIQSKSLLLQVVRQGNPEAMTAFVERLQKSGDVTRRNARTLLQGAKRSGRGRARSFVFRFQPQEKTFHLALRFRRGAVSPAELIVALETVLSELRRKVGSAN